MYIDLLRAAGGPKVGGGERAFYQTDPSLASNAVQRDARQNLLRDCQNLLRDWI